VPGVLSRTWSGNPVLS